MEIKITEINHHVEEKYNSPGAEYKEFEYSGTSFLKLSIYDPERYEDWFDINFTIRWKSKKKNKRKKQLIKTLRKISNAPELKLIPETWE